MRARRLPGGLTLALGALLLVALALPVGLAARGWDAVQQSAKGQLAQLETGVNKLGGKVLDTASSLTIDQGDLSTPTPTPIVVLAALPEPASQPASANQAIVLAPTTVGRAIGGGNGAASMADLAPTAAAELASPTAEAPTEEPTPTAEPTPTDLPPTPTPEPTPTDLPPTPTAEPTPTRAVPTPTRAAATPTRVAPTPTVVAAAAAAAAAPGAGAATYTVQPGDNWFSIAQRYGITQETLAAYNDSLPSDILQVDQILRIPPAGAVVALPTATATPTRPTPTPAATATPAPTATPVIVMLAAPTLLTPATGDGFTAGTQPVLTWKPVAGMGPQDYYFVVVRYPLRDGRASAIEERVTGPSFTVPQWYYDLANTPDRLGTWSVQVRRMGANNQELIVSPFSESRTFYWR
ncbi:MAG TPA: LysM peptidoglycan-binding domain-containing protein [Anaerolineae bacterium]|nr:LysM peptidoglycan-binding domain-containing protein [Anaerolineae bacterium]HNU03311.1 LysM peptidoglycan-binding domain-containing protein [Anaerolineae bacterium]